MNQLLIVTAILLALPAAAQRGPQPGLRVIVIQGEDAVNIIQQKSAVAAIVEVRDENDLPVGGATVTFSVSGGQAVFAGGAQQITVTTNAAGRAAASALNPLQAGPVRIQVQAAFQGQTATTTIAQTNAATAADAAARAAQKAQGGQGASGSGTATGATTAGAAGASGGGLSGAAIAGIVGGVAAGAGLGLKAASGGGDDGGSNGGGGGGGSGGRARPAGSPCRRPPSRRTACLRPPPSW